MTLFKLSEDTPEWNPLWDIKCPICQSESWRRRKTDKMYVCLKCGEEYEIITSNTNNNH
jgi:ribosomal protein L37AE/L43A